jgi:superoxide dismutase, Cu-Zn family
MKNKTLVTLFAIVIVALSCKLISNSDNAKIVRLIFEPKSNSKVSGTGSFVEKKGVVYFEALLTGLTPGEHAIHIHEKSDCSSPDGKSAGGHWNPTFKNHGQIGQTTEYHKGDIGNFTADDNGNAKITFSTSEWCIDCDDETKNIVGKGLIIHEGKDDYVSQPAGNAGSRVSCSAIIK